MSIPIFILPKKVSLEFLEILSYVKDFISDWDWDVKPKTVRIKLIQSMKYLGRQRLNVISLRSGTRDMSMAETGMVLVHELRHYFNLTKGLYLNVKYIKFSKTRFDEYAKQPEEVDCNKQAYYFGLEFYPNEYQKTYIYELYKKGVVR